MEKFTHAQLCEIAKKWLLRPNSRGGHGCQVALSECRSGFDGEMPDAIGYRAVSQDTETVLVEVKVSVADFRADALKPHRAEGEGMGLFRYYMCPAGVIQPEDVPPRWGLLWVDSRGRIEAILGPVALSSNCGTFGRVCEPWKHTKDSAREMWLLVRVMARIHDPDKMKNALNTAVREQARLTRICNAQTAEIQALRNPPASNTSAGEFQVATPRKLKDHNILAISD